ncbi:hypothetical protein Tco_0127035 [Tanacetum coccineum]
METHHAPKPSVEVSKIASSCEICGGPHDTQYCMENPKQAFVDYSSSRTDKAGGLMSKFMASQEARLSRFEDPKQQSEMTNKISTFLKAINDRMMGALPSDTVKNPKLNVNSTSSILSARSSPKFPKVPQIDETEDENEEEPIPTPMSKKTSRGPRLNSKAAKNKEKETQIEVKKRARIVWSQDEELILVKSFIQISEDPKTGCDQQKDSFWYKILDVYNAEAKKRGFIERTKNMLTGKWTPMNASVQKFNQLVSETLAHSGENDHDWITRVEILYKTHTGCDFKHKSAWLFLKGKHKWTNPESTNARRNRFRVTDEEPEHFRDDVLPRPPRLQRLAKSQRSDSNSTASSGSNPMMYQEFMKEQYELDRKAKMQVIEQESEERRQLIHAQRIAEEMRVLQIDTRGMDPADAVIINAQKARIRAAYQPPTN